MSNTLKLGNGKWATGKDTLLSFSDTNNNYKPLAFSFSRASSGTVINQQGLIETVGTGEPRIDFKDNTKGALLLEPQRSNVLLQSNQFDTTWINSGTSVTSGYLGLDGTNSAWLLTKGANDFENTRQNITFSGIHTFSVYLKKGTNTTAILRSTGGLDAKVEINLIDGTTSGEVNTTSVKTESMGNDWWRCSITFNASSNTAVRIYPEAPLGGATAGNIYIQYAQLEQGSYATSYIPTSGSAVTRIGETCNNGANEQVINSTEGVLYLETKGFIDVPSSSGYIQLSKNGEASFNNSLTIQHRNNGYLRVYVNGTATSDIHFNENIDFTENHKIAVLYKLNGYKLFIDGVSQSLFGTPTQTVFSGLDNLSFDNRGTLSWNGSIKDVRVYNTALTDQELAALTTI